MNYFNEGSLVDFVVPCSYEKLGMPYCPVNDLYPTKPYFANGSRERNEVKRPERPAGDRSPHPIRSLRYAPFPAAIGNTAILGLVRY